MKLSDYILDTSHIRWPEVLPTWLWLIPDSITVWFVNRFGDVFLALDDKSIHRLNMDSGTLDRLAESRKEFEEKFDESQNRNDLLMIPIVDRLVFEGMTLSPQKCYGFVQLPILGGSYDSSNILVVNTLERISFLGDVHRQIANFPNGTKIKFTWTE